MSAPEARPAAEPLPAAACRGEIALVVRPRDLNTYQQVFGGCVMHRIDELATDLVGALSGRPAVTAHLDRLTFTAGIAAFQRMRVAAAVTRTFRSSMDVAVEVEGQDPLTGRTWSTARATLAVVGLDLGGRPTALPAVLPADAAERAAFEEAGERRRRRMEERRAAAGEAMPPAPGPEEADRLSWVGCSRIVPARHSAGAGQASAGWILALADELAAICASRHCAGPSVTVAVGDVAFLRPVPVGDVVALDAYLTAAFRTSMEVRVDVWQRPRYGRARAPVARCHFTYVALGPEGRPVAVPPFVPRHPWEEELAAAAARRRERSRTAARAPRP